MEERPIATTTLAVGHLPCSTSKEGNHSTHHLRKAHTSNRPPIMARTIKLAPHRAQLLKAMGSRHSNRRSKSTSPNTTTCGRVYS